MDNIGGYIAKKVKSDYFDRACGCEHVGSNLEVISEKLVTWDTFLSNIWRIITVTMAVVAQWNIDIGYINSVCTQSVTISSVAIPGDWTDSNSL